MVSDERSPAGTQTTRHPRLLRDPRLLRVSSTGTGRGVVSIHASIRKAGLADAPLSVRFSPWRVWCGVSRHSRSRDPHCCRRFRSLSSVCMAPFVVLLDPSFNYHGGASHAGNNNARCFLRSAGKMKSKRQTRKPIQLTQLRAVQTSSDCRNLKNHLET